MLFRSNVEDYLFRGGSFEKYMANVKALPHAPGAVVIRSVFRRGRALLPGYASESLVQSLDAMLAAHAADKYTSYYDLIGE